MVPEDAERWFCRGSSGSALRPLAWCEGQHQPLSGSSRASSPCPPLHSAHSPSCPSACSRPSAAAPSPAQPSSPAVQRARSPATRRHGSTCAAAHALPRMQPPRHRARSSPWSTHASVCDAVRAQVRAREHAERSTTCAACRRACGIRGRRDGGPRAMHVTLRRKAPAPVRQQWSKRRGSCWGALGGDAQSHYRAVLMVSMSSVESVPMVMVVVAISARA